VRKWARPIAAALGLSLVAGLLTSLLVYLHYVPNEIVSAKPTEPSVFPAIALDLAARLSGCEARPRFEALNAYTFGFLAPECEVAVASVLAKQLTPSAHGVSHLRYAAASLSGTIWLTRHWTADQVLATTLSLGYFGRNTRGLGEAAEAYFGLAPGDLTREELAQLVAILALPSAFDPWCQPDRNRERANLLLGHDPALRLETRLLPAPIGTCARTQ
jgi:hypothetical protein